MKKYLFLLLQFCFLNASFGEGILPNFFDVYGGYRWDRVESTANIYNPNNFKPSTDTLIAKDLSIWELGLKTQAFICSHFYIRGFYSHGWIEKGDYSEKSSALLKGDIKGDTIDGQGGFGYLVCLTKALSLGIVGGWGFNEQSIRMTNITLTPSTAQLTGSDFNHLKFESRWNGPWVGLDVAYQMCSFLLSGGYELHLTDWRGAFLLDHPLPGLAFSDRRRIGNAFGHVVFLDGLWSFSCNWHLALGVKYQNWSTPGSGEIRAIESSPFTSSLGPVVTRIPTAHKAKWTSCEVTLRLGYEF